VIVGTVLVVFIILISCSGFLFIVGAHNFWRQVFLSSLISSFLSTLSSILSSLSFISYLISSSLLPTSHFPCNILFLFLFLFFFFFFFFFPLSLVFFLFPFLLFSPPHQFAETECIRDTQKSRRRREKKLQN
jgi:hypothetical protein